jgi:hypothetical protein
MLSILYPESWDATFFAATETKLVPKVDGPEAFARLLDGAPISVKRG